jgi:hypothetical protein
MNKLDLNFGGIISLIVGVYSMYYMLLSCDALPWSINAVETSLSHSIKHWRILVVGLMPIYVSLTIFGTAFSSLFVGSTLHKWLVGFLQEL